MNHPWPPKILPTTSTVSPDASCAWAWASTGPACTARFDFNDKAIESGITLFVSLALGYNKVKHPL